MDCTNVGGIQGLFGTAVLEAFETLSGPFCKAPRPPASAGVRNNKGEKKAEKLTGHQLP